jgi:hypothetical protein
MTNKIAKALKEFKEGLTSGFRNEFAKRTGYGIDITLDHNAVRSAGFLFAMCARYVDDTYAIIVDDEFNLAPKEVREFIIWHELGHIHNDKDSIRTLECEHKADMYAVSKVGQANAIIALNYMWVRLSTIDITACADIPSRLKELGANVDSMYILLANGTKLYEPQLRKLI